MKKEQEVEKIFSGWFHECNSNSEISELLGIIHDMASQEAANRYFDLNKIEH